MKINKSILAGGNIRNFVKMELQDNSITRDVTVPSTRDLVNKGQRNGDVIRVRF